MELVYCKLALTLALSSHLLSSILESGDSVSQSSLGVCGRIIKGCRWSGISRTT